MFMWQCDEYRYVKGRGLRDNTCSHLQEITLDVTDAITISKATTTTKNTQFFDTLEKEQLTKRQGKTNYEHNLVRIT